MASLYLDTSERLAWGILNEKMDWILYSEYPVRQAASTIHSIIDEGLTEKKINIDEIKTLFVLNGPGSYTGIRISEGIAQVFEWQGIKCYSFHAHEIPQLLGEKSGCWVGEAFKGEIFEYHWNEAENRVRLLKKSGYQMSSGGAHFTHYGNELVNDGQLTSLMIQNNPSKLFKRIEELNLRKEPYYYRTNEEEFTVGGR